ncbi:hypothetical protein JB92DRAFT_3150395 [Gautieria morchelliformis]|nr:hypothetical protein JB92DRAFT_3150395 [Gautieria morchelliformis]
MAALPTTTHPPATPPISRWRLPRHRILVALVLLSSLLVLLSLYTLSSAPGIDAVRRTFTAISQSHARPPPTPPPASPPLPPFPVDRGMATIIEWESALPQLAPLDIHGGGRYLRFLNEAWGVGFNNQLQEMSVFPPPLRLPPFFLLLPYHSIAHAHLAYLSNRSYVVQPLNFPGESEWYPLSAFLRGALVGSPSSPHDHPYTADPILAPHPRPSPLRAVSRAKFASACPDYEHAPELDYDTIARTLEAQHSPAKSDSDSGSAHAPRGDTGGLRPAPSYMTVSVAPLARAFGFEQDTPADVIMRGWEGLLGVGGGRAKGAASARDSADGQLNNPELPALAPGDATCVTVHPESEHLMDYR